MKYHVNVDSILETKASGNLNIMEDLQQPEGKSIAQLIYEQENNEQTKDQKNQEEDQQSS